MGNNAIDSADKVSTNHRPLNVVVLGATGSIGRSTLAVIDANPELYRVIALTGYRQADKLAQLSQRFLPEYVWVDCDGVDDYIEAMQASKEAMPSDVLSDAAQLSQLASLDQADIVVAGIVGSAGLQATYAAVCAGKRVLLANKEALVMAGELMMEAARTYQAQLLPIDSEHNAIFQCLPLFARSTESLNQPLSASIPTSTTSVLDYDSAQVRQLWLTASGGPFRQSSYAEMQAATPEVACQHPNWSMGKKISIDSATMMNKGLELIEAGYLFDMAADRIKVVIHPQSIIHSLVEYIDGSFLAQLGYTSMQIPIAHALGFPNRISSGTQPLDLTQLATLEFAAPDEQKFRPLSLARAALTQGGGAPLVLNAANEVAVEEFLQGRIQLTDIARVAETMLNQIPMQSLTSIEDMIAADALVRRQTRAALSHLDS